MHTHILTYVATVCNVHLACNIHLAVITLLSHTHVGGSNGSEYLDSVECYDPSKLNWISVTKLPTVRFGAAACTLSKSDHIIAAECVSPVE